MNPVEAINEVRSGVFQVALEKDRNTIGAGTGFLTEGGILTNYHVLPPEGYDYDTVNIRFEDVSSGGLGDPIRLSKVDLTQKLISWSPPNEHDYVFYRWWEPEFENRHVFQLANNKSVLVGEQLCFMGYPFVMEYLTAHMGYISSVHTKQGVKIFQIDGSINGGNSGGPLFELETCKVVGLVTRAHTGILIDQFNNLIGSLRKNQEIMESLGKSGGIAFGTKFGTVTVHGALRASFCSMEEIARNLKRSANVGIGYAFSIDHARAAIQNALS